MNHTPITSANASDDSAMTMREILARQVSSGFEGLRGTAISGHVPIAQSVVNELLTSSGEPLSRASVEVQGGNTLEIRYRLLFPMSATVVLDEAVDLPPTGPRITLTMRSAVIAGVLALKKLPFAEMNGRRVTIDLGRIPALARYAAAMKCVERVRLTTSEQMLIVDFRVGVAVDRTAPVDSRRRTE
jgi:hypothetical protein